MKDDFKRSFACVIAQKKLIVGRDLHEKSKEKNQHFHAKCVHCPAPFIAIFSGRW
jgi:pyrimidine deaminase RibD-like protein